MPLPRVLSVGDVSPIETANLPRTVLVRLPSANIVRAMKKIIQTIALLVCSFCPPMAAINPAAQQLLVAAKQQASLFHK
jgi:hypothetical protein